MQVKQEAPVNVKNEPKDENFQAMKEEDNPLVTKFKQLWFACYFERRLTKQMIDNADLQAIIDDLFTYFTKKEAGKSGVDFRRAVALLQGLHVLFSRKMASLVGDSKNMLR